MVASEKSERASIASHEKTTRFGASWCNHISDPDITRKHRRYFHQIIQARLKATQAWSCLISQNYDTLKYIKHHLFKYHIFIRFPHLVSVLWCSGTSHMNPSGQKSSQAVEEGEPFLSDQVGQISNPHRIHVWYIPKYLTIEINHSCR